MIPTKWRADEMKSREASLRSPKECDVKKVPASVTIVKMVYDLSSKHVVMVVVVAIVHHVQQVSLSLRTVVVVHHDKGIPCR